MKYNPEGPENRIASARAVETMNKNLTNVEEELGADEYEHLITELTDKRFQDLNPEDQDKILSIKEKLGGLQ